MNTDVKYWFLRNHQLFNQLNDLQYDELCVIGRFKEATKNEVIYFTHERLERIYFLKKGVVKIAYVDNNGNEITKDVLKEGDIFGEISLNKNVDHSGEYAKAVSSDVCICSFRIDDFEKLLSKNPQLSLKFSKTVGEKLTTIEQRYTNLKFKDVKTRLFEFLSSYATKNGELHNGFLTVENVFTHQDIASIIGSSRQTITTLMGELEQEEKIKYTRKSIKIL